MKIVFYASHLTLLNGGGLFLRDYANALSEREHEVSVLAQRIDQNIYKFNNNISVFQIGCVIPSNPLYWINFNKIKIKNLKILEELDADVIISNDFPVNYFCAKSNHRRNFKHVYYCHEPYRFFHDKKFYSKLPFLKRFALMFIRLIFKKYDKKGVKDADLILCNSNYTKKKIKTCYIKESKVLYPIPNKENSLKSDEFQLRHKLKLDKEQNIIFSLGLTHPSKGIKELIFIFSKILNEVPESILLIGGRIGKYNQKILKKSIKDLKIPNKNIKIYGIIEKELLNQFYAQSTLTFYTAIDESFGQIPIESMRYGTPVIAFEGGPSETIKDGETGYIIKNLDLNEYIQKSMKIITNKELYESFSKKAKKHVEVNFNFEKTISEFELILYKLHSKE